MYWVHLLPKCLFSVFVREPLDYIKRPVIQKYGDQAENYWGLFHAFLSLLT